MAWGPPTPREKLWRWTSVPLKLPEAQGLLCLSVRTEFEDGRVEWRADFGDTFARPKGKTPLVAWGSSRKGQIIVKFMKREASPKTVFEGLTAVHLWGLGITKNGDD